MWPVGSYGEMFSQLAWNEYVKGTDIPITAGILVADCRRQFARENIFNYIKLLDESTGPLIDFYIPGYKKILTKPVDPEKDYYDKFYDNMYELRGQRYAFSPSIFEEFIRYLKEGGIEVSHEVQLILFDYSPIREERRTRFISIDSITTFLLEQDYRTGKLSSIDEVLDKIINLAKRTTEFEEFRNMNKRMRTISFVKENLPNAISSLITGKLTSL